MGLLKTVFEVNLQLFLKDKKSVPRSLLFFVIRDYLGNTPLQNLRNTLLQDLSRIWASLSKPPGLENSRIEDYFDFTFATLPHKILQPEKFVSDTQKLGLRFREGYKDPKHSALRLDNEDEPVFLSEYHRRIPADGFALYTSGIWDQIVENKDLDLPTQQELLAQYRCDEIAREVLVVFDEVIVPLESQQADSAKSRKPMLLPSLGSVMRKSRQTALQAFETEASRYHKGVYGRKLEELLEKTDTRLNALFKGQLDASHKLVVRHFSDAVSESVKSGQKQGSTYDFASIVDIEKKKALQRFEAQAKELLIEGAPWSNYTQQLTSLRRDLEDASAQLRKEEMRRLATRIERWVKTHLSDGVGMAFNGIGTGCGGSGAPEDEERPTSEKDVWDRIWGGFTETVEKAEARFTERARGFDASPEEVEIGLWRLRRKSWSALRAKIEDEVMEGNLLLKLRENFEDKFRYDSEGVPRIWRPTDDIEGAYTSARTSTLALIPLLSRFRLSSTSAHPPLEAWVGKTPISVSPTDEDLLPIGGVDDDDGKTLAEEMTIISDAKMSDLASRFKKTADGIFVEAKRGALGGVTQVPLYFYALLLVLGWNELVAVLRNPLYFILLALGGAGAYVTYNLNLWGPMLRMADAASQQALEVAKERLREFLEDREQTGSTARAAKRAVKTHAKAGGEEYEMKPVRKGLNEDMDGDGDT